MSEEARKAEASGKSVTFEFRGESFDMPTEYDDYPLSYIEAVLDGKPLAIQAREILGPEQWAKVRGMGLTGRGLEELGETMQSAAGVSPGNSEASSD
jgi:hypothetical protein